MTLQLGNIFNQLVGELRTPPLGFWVTRRAVPVCPLHDEHARAHQPAQVSYGGQCGVLVSVGAR